eukprot:731559_1
MQQIALLAVKVARAKAKSCLKQIYTTHEHNQDESTKLDAAIMSSLSNALLDDMDKLDAKLDALCKAPMKTSQQYLNTGLNALVNTPNSDICDNYFNLAYQKAQEGFHTVQLASDKIICGRIAMMSAIFAFRNNMALLLNELRLRFIDILSDYDVQIILKSYHKIHTSTARVSMKKLWTSKTKMHQYRAIVYDIVELYHLLTTQLYTCLMINTPQLHVDHYQQKQIKMERKQNDRDLVRHKQNKSPFSSGAWLLLGVPKCFQHKQLQSTLNIVSQPKLSLSTTESIQTVQSIIQNRLTKFVLFAGCSMSYKQYNKFIDEYKGDFGGKRDINNAYNKNMFDNHMMYNLKLIATRGIRHEPNMILVGKTPLIIHCVGVKHWNLARFLCKYYPLNVLQFNTHNRWTPLVYALIDNQIELIRLICDIWDNQLKYQMDAICATNAPITNDFDLLNHCDTESNPSLLFCRSIESIHILCNDYGVDINSVSTKLHQTILICCVHRRLYDVVEYILNTYHPLILVNIQNNSGNSAFMNAFRKIDHKAKSIRMGQIFLDWNQKHNKIDFTLLNKCKQNVFDLLEEAKSSLPDEDMYQTILNQMTKQAQFN